MYLEVGNSQLPSIAIPSLYIWSNMDCYLLTPPNHAIGESDLNVFGKADCNHAKYIY